MPDFHSGDDLGSSTRRCIGRATVGKLHYKISPSLQLLYAEVLFKTHPELFDFWWEDTVAYAEREAPSGSSLAKGCLRELGCGQAAPSPRAPVFQHFCFATIGRRNAEGRYLNRERFYCLSRDFHTEYTRQVVHFLKRITEDLFLP
jgi:hypothetical protein